MKLFKKLVLIAVSALITINTVNANTPSNAQQNKQSAQKEDPNLKLFNQAIGIKLVYRSIVNVDNQTQLLTKYELENKGKSSIKSVHWVSGLHDTKQIIFTQDIPVNFEKPLKAKAKIVIDILTPLSSIPENARNVFLDPKTPIGSISGAKSLTFNNGKKIILK